MKQWNLTGRAKRDLADIRRFTRERWGLLKAEKYLDGIYEKIQIAAEHPAIGIDRSKSLKLGCEVRSVLCGSHIIYYVVFETYISVAAILHQNMVPKRHLITVIQE